jgi:hypothetical protein
VFSAGTGVRRIWATPKLNLRWAVVIVRAEVWKKIGTLGTNLEERFFCFGRFVGWGGVVVGVGLWLGCGWVVVGLGCGWVVVVRSYLLLLLLLLFSDVLTFVALFDTLRYQYHVEAAKEGYAPAQFNAGTHYFIGQGVEQDFAKAFSWFQKASDQGNNTKICLCVSSVCIVLCPPLISVVVFFGLFFLFAAGMSQASFNLGQMYFNGRGVEENHGKGVALMEKASSLGNKDATQVLVDIEKEAKGALKEGRVVDGARVVEEEAKVEEGVVVNGKK